MPLVNPVARSGKRCGTGHNPRTDCTIKIGMNLRKCFLRVPLLLLLGVAVSTYSPAQKSQSTAADANGVSVHMTITVEGKKGKAIPVLHPEDVMVYQGHDRDKVTELVSQRGAPQQLFILVDDALDSSIGNQLQDVRKFVSSLPPTTAVGIAYMRNSSVQVLQDPTTDHAAAAKAVRLTLGNVGAGSSPYLALQDLVKRWPDTGVRRETVMITDGLDRFYGGGLSNPYVDSAIQEAQKAGILVDAIYARGIGHFGHNMFRVNSGQMYLSQVTAETGGESYINGFDTPVSFAPFFQDLSARFDNQYRLAFLAKPGKKAGLQSIKLKTEVPDVELVHATRVYVPAGQ
jgi:hypothetical protein